jgi:hypothetical protein
MTNDEEKEGIYKVLEKIALTNVEVIRMEMEVCIVTSPKLTEILMYHKKKYSPTRTSKTWRTHQKRYRTSS